MSPIDELIAELCPDGVDYYALGDCGTIFGGLTGKSKEDFSNGNVRYVSYVNVYTNPAVDLTANNFVLVRPGERQRTLQRGDILFTGSSETADEVGMSSVVTLDVDEPLYLNSFCIGYRFNDPNLLEPDFAKHLFRGREMRSQLIGTASGVTRFNVSKVRLAKLRVPVPPIEVQREIVRILDHFTALEAELEAELELELEARRRQYAVYRDQLLTFDDSVPRVTLPQVSSNLDSKRRPVTKSAREPGNIPYYGASGIVDYVSDFIFEGDYLLVSEDGANLLARSTPIAFSVSGKTWVNNHAHILSFETYTSRRFTEIFLNSIDLGPYISGSSQPKLNQANLNQIILPWPTRESQNRIVSILDNFEALTHDLSVGLPAELNVRRKQYEYYRDRLLTFKELAS